VQLLEVAVEPWAVRGVVGAAGAVVLGGGEDAPLEGDLALGVLVAQTLSKSRGTLPDTRPNFEFRYCRGD
jgi:hypothetical protein